MAVKSQINVAVDDAAFVEFAAAFAKYETALKGLPAVWASAEKSTAKTRTNFEATAISVGVLGSSIASVTARGKEFYQVTTATARHWKDLAVSTHNVARNIIATTESLLKWTGIVGVLTGGAGLWGFDRLAGNVANQRSAAFGTGGDRAGRLAFTTNFRRIGDPEGLLGRVAGMQADMRQSQPLRALGLSTEDIRSLSPEEAAMKAMQGGARFAAEDKAKGLPVGSDPRLRAFTTPEQIWLRDHRAEIEGLIAETRKEKAAGRFMLKPGEEKAAQDFETNMSKAGQAIETTLVKGLVKLAGPLGELSDSVVKLVASFTEKALPDIVKDLGEGVEWLAKEIDSPSFVSKVESLVSMIGSMAGAFGGLLGGLARFARWLGVDVPGATTIGQAQVQASSPSSGGGGGTGSGYGVHGQSRDQFLTGPARNRGGTGAASSPATGGKRRSGGGAGAGDSGGGGRAPEGNLRERGLRLMDRLISMGWTPESAAMAAGNAQAESNINASGPAGDHGASVGMFQDQGPRRTALRAFQARHHEMSAEESNIAYYDQERQQQAWKHEHDMSRAGAFSHATEGYGDTTEGKRVRMSNTWLRTYRESHSKNVIITPTPGGNTSLGSGAASAGSP